MVGTITVVIVVVEVDGGLVGNTSAGALREVNALELRAANNGISETQPW